MTIKELVFLMDPRGYGWIPVVILFALAVVTMRKAIWKKGRFARLEDAIALTLALGGLVTVVWMYVSIARTTDQEIKSLALPMYLAAFITAWVLSEKVYKRLVSLWTGGTIAKKDKRG